MALTGWCGARLATSATTVTTCVHDTGHDGPHYDGTGISWDGHTAVVHLDLYLPGDPQDTR